MKKLFKKVNRKVRYTIGGIILLILLIADNKCSQSFKQKNENEQHKDVEVELIVETDVPEPYLETYEELQDDYEKEGRESDTTIEEIDTTIEEIDDTVNSTYEDTKESIEPEASSDTEKKDSSTEEKAVIIDESDETMKDETANYEKEYDVNQEPQGKVEFHKPAKEEGKEVQDNTKPGGKQGVGVWS